MATAEIRAKASLDKTEFESGIASMKSAAASLKGVIAGAFSVGAIVGLGRAAMSAAGQLQDMSDQFGITSSEALGFIRAVRESGGSAEKATVILQRLQAQQEKIGDTRPISEYIEEMRQAYIQTGNLGKIIDVVGTKSASIFAATLKSMSGELATFNDEVQNLNNFKADRAQEKVEAGKDTGLSWINQVAVGVAEGAAAYASFFGELFFPSKAQQKAIAEARMFSKEWWSAAFNYKDAFDAFDSVYRLAFDEYAQKMNMDAEIKKAVARRKYVSGILDQELPKGQTYWSGMGAGSSIYAEQSAYNYREKDFVGPPRPIPEKPFQIPRFDDLRRIGGGIIGGKSVDTLRDIYKTLQKQKDFEKETAENTAKMARGLGGGSVF